MAYTPPPTVIDNYLPSGINRIVVYPKPSKATTVFALDVDDATIDHYATYPGTVLNLNTTGLKSLANTLQDAGQETGTVPDLPSALAKATTSQPQTPPGRIHRQVWNFEEKNVRLPATAIYGSGAFVLAGFGSVGLFGLELVAAIPAVVIGLGTGFGLHLEGMRREHNDNTERANYDEALTNDTRLLALSKLPRDLVSIVGAIARNLSAIRSYGLSTDEHAATVTQELNTLIRSTHAKHHHNAELDELNTILNGVDADDIRADHDLFRTDNHRKQHLASRNDAATRANRAIQRLRDLAETTGREARTAKAKIAATRHLIEKPHSS